MGLSPIPGQVRSSSSAQFHFHFKQMAMRRVLALRGDDIHPWPLSLVGDEMAVTNRIVNHVVQMCRRNETIGRRRSRGHVNFAWGKSAAPFFTD